MTPSSCKNMRLTPKHLLLKYFLFAIFATSTVALFIYLNRLHPYYFIDEAFHVPQTLRYCAGNFTEWDPKITTLPGLYLVTALVLSPLDLCTIPYIRCTNLICTFANFFLIYMIIKEICKNYHMQKWDERMQLAVAYNVTLFPPLFFWCFLYYTDILSVNMVLITLLFHLRKQFKSAAFFGLLSVLVRQTNIVWVAFLAMERLLDLLEIKSQDVKHEHVAVSTYLRLSFNNAVKDKRSNLFVKFLKFIIYIGNNLYPYIIVGLMFLAFLIWNKGIVVGDRTAHVPTIHIPQIFYFSTFVLCFLWPYLIPYLKDFFYFIQKHLIFSSCFFAIGTFIVHYNTLVHPYVLADNRHYVFYIWNRLMGRYLIFKYLLVPVYSFAIYAILRTISHLRILTRVTFIGSVAIVLIPQLLLEPRYFIIPYIFYRLSIRKPEIWQISIESLTTLTVNCLQFLIFVKKVFYWQDQEYPQRIAW